MTNCPCFSIGCGCKDCEERFSKLVDKLLNRIQGV